LKAIRRGGGYVSRGLREYAGAYRDEHVLSPGDVLVAHTDLTQAADVLGAVARVPSWEPYAKLVPSLDLAVVRPKSDELTPEFIFGAVGSPAFRAHARAHASGTTVLHLPRDAAGLFRLAVPPPELIGEHTAEVRPMLAMADALTGESRTLAELRDALLPRLVSGQIRVREAEEFVESA
jgi:type I restriction enzyme S subunit